MKKDTAPKQELPDHWWENWLMMLLPISRIPKCEAMFFTLSFSASLSTLPAFRPDHEMFSSIWQTLFSKSLFNILCFACVLAHSLCSDMMIRDSGSTCSLLGKKLWSNWMQQAYSFMSTWLRLEVHNFLASRLIGIITSVSWQRSVRY